MSKPDSTISTSSVKSDAAIEAEIVNKGLNSAPRVTKLQIDELMHRVVFSFIVPAGTTSTFCHAFLDGKFLLATGHSACVSPENFNASTGESIAKSKAEQAARDKLWELEGYALYKQVPVESSPSLTEQRLQLFVDMATLGDAFPQDVLAPLSALLDKDPITAEQLLKAIDDANAIRNKPAATQHTEDPDH